MDGMELMGWNGISGMGRICEMEWVGMGSVGRDVVRWVGQGGSMGLGGICKVGSPCPASQRPRHPVSPCPGDRWTEKGCVGKRGFSWGGWRWLPSRQCVGSR